MPIKLNSPGGGSVTLDVPSMTTANTLVLPARSGNIITSGDSNTVTSGMIASAAITPVKLSQPLTVMSSQLTTTGTTKDFTSIPSWVTRITVMFNQVNTNGGSAYLVQIGTGGTLTTSGYVSHSSFSQVSASATGGTASTAGFVIHHTLSSYTIGGLLTLVHLGSNLWIASGVVGNATYTAQSYGVVTLAGVLNILRVTSVTPDTFNGGSVNVLYE